MTQFWPCRTPGGKLVHYTRIDPAEGLGATLCGYNVSRGHEGWFVSGAELCRNCRRCYIGIRRREACD